MVPRSLKIKVFEEPRSPYGGRHLPPTPEVAASSGIDAEADIALASLGWMEPNNAKRRQVCLLLALSGLFQPSRRMSAFRGKADASSCSPRCPLMTQSGHDLEALSAAKPSLRVRRCTSCREDHQLHAEVTTEANGVVSRRSLPDGGRGCWRAAYPGSPCVRAVS